MQASNCETFSHKVPSSMLDCVPTRGKTTQIGFSINYLRKVAMGSSACTLENTNLACYSCLEPESNKKRKDSLDWVLLVVGPQFPKILVPMLIQHTLNVNIKCTGKSEWLKLQYYLYVISFLEHWYILILLFWY